MATEMGAIARLLEATEEEITPLQREVNRIGRTLAIAVLVIAAIVVGSVLAMSGVTSSAQFFDVLLLGVSLAVAAVPEGLPAILSVVLALGVQRLSRHKAIMRKLAAVETLGAISVICTDKTGTLTRSEMMIVRAVSASGRTDLTGSGYDPAGEVSVDGQALEPGPLLDEQVILLGGGCLANNAELAQDADGRWTIQGDPTEAAFLVAERKLGVHEKRIERFARLVEVPFTSDRKMMSTVQADHDRDDEPALVAKGAPDVLLERCTHQRVGSKEVALDAGSRQRILAQVDELTEAALRPLAVAYRRLEAGEEPASGEALEHDLVYVGTVGIIDPPREEVAPAISQAHDAGIRVVMITGDNPGTAARIAADLGILPQGGEVVTGMAIDDLDDEAFGRIVGGTTVYARVSSAHKLRIVDALQAQGELVAMTGDGVNDAPALKSADIGIAMGITGTQVTREAARMILADDNFATIVRAVREGRGIFENIRKFLRYLLSSNMGEVLTVFLGVIAAGVFGLADPAGGVAMPLLVTQILWINLITDSGLALAIGLDRPADDLMQRPPRSLERPIIDAAMWRWATGMGLVMALSALLTLDMYLPGGLIAGTDDLDTARTTAFTVLVFAQLFNCLSSRSDHDSAAVKLFENHWLWISIVTAAALQVMVVQVGFFNAAFSTTPLSLSQWTTCIGMASLALWFAEGAKLLRRFAARQGSPTKTRQA
ncbi:MAG: cation-translocating P-type ATPase [Burkholderiaceae bacterium]